MSTAYLDFMSALEGLRDEGAALSSISGGVAKPRSAPHLRLNGLTVVAFATLEDFIRRRAYEVVSWLGAGGVTFGGLPQSLQTAILIGTIKGINYSIDKTEKTERDVIIQLEALLLSQAGENVAFTPSEYFFGRSASNISEGSVKNLLQAFGYTDADGAMDEVARQLSLTHMGRVLGLFYSLAQNRHSAAHAFPPDYRHADFLNDIDVRLPLIAVCFDTCISQLALLVKRNFEESISKKFAQREFFDAALVRIAEWQPADKSWIEILQTKKVKGSTKREFQQRLQKFKERTLGVGNSIIVKNERGVICEWIQPVP